MTAATTVRVGQVWADRAGSLALVETVCSDSAVLRYVTGPKVGGRTFPMGCEMSHDWRFHSENTRLTCISSMAAQEAARFLTGKGLTDVLVDGRVVSAPLTVRSVMQFADDAFNNGWAHDEDCARMIGGLG